MENQAALPKIILVVDDEINVCKSIKNAILQENYSIETALSGEEAMEKSKSGHFDLVISDLMMPGMSGLDLLKALKEWRPEIKVIMVTGYPTIRTAVESIRMGAFDYIPKPFTPNELRSLTARALAKTEKTGRVEKKPVLPSGLHYMIGHTWLRKEEGQTATVGIVHDYLVTIKAIQAVDLPDINQIVRQGEACAKIICKDGGIHQIWAPAGGAVLEINELLRKNPEILFSSPYNQGWIFKITPTNLKEDLQGLLQS